VSDFNYPEHKHPHELLHKEPNGQRILACTECPFFMVDEDYRDDQVASPWGHKCRVRGARCESHMELFEPCKPRED